MQRSGLSLIGGIIYINLAHRIDRKASLEKELNRLSISQKQRDRLEGIYDELNGTRGCVKSHIRALKYALEKGWPSVLILEDDCIFSVERAAIDQYIDRFMTAFQDDWDVLFFGTDIREFEKTKVADYLRVLFSVRAHAYLVNGAYIPRLIEHYQETLALLEDDLFFTSSMAKALDRRWEQLQKVDRWYGGQRMFAHQMQSYSDIEKGIKQFR